jgi:hypothetical protein
MKILLIALALISVFSVQSLSQDKFDVQFNYVGELELNENNGIIIAYVSDISSDLDQNIYICDQRDHSIKVFTSERKYLRTIGKKGKGPGELLNPKNISISLDNKIYIWDSNKRISVFSSNGTFVESYGVRDFDLDDFCISPSNEQIFCSAASPYHHFPEKIDFTSIYVFNIKNKQWAKIGLLPFMGRTTNGYQLAATTFIKSNRSDKIIFATGYPYEIKYYKQSGELNKTITSPRKIPKPTEVEMRPNLKVLIPRIDIRKIILLPYGYFMVAVADLGDNFKQFYENKIQAKDLKVSLKYDIYNSEGEFIQKYSVKNPLEMGLIMHYDFKQFVYTYHPDWDIPNIKQYEMSIKNNENY